MSGWADSHPLKFDLTPTKAKFYLRRDISHVPQGEDPVTYLLKEAGLQGVEETKWGGWTVHATVGQIWTVLSGQPSRPDAFSHEGKSELIEAGLYVPVFASNGSET